MTDYGNLLRETIEVMAENGVSSEDVCWVGSRELWATWDEFVAVADVEYYAGFGMAEIAADLLVVGDAWWMERHQYDGSEWWEFKRRPDRPGEHRALRSVLYRDRTNRTGYLSGDLADINTAEADAP